MSKWAWVIFPDYRACIVRADSEQMARRKAQRLDPRQYVGVGVRPVVRLIDMDNITLSSLRKARRGVLFSAAETMRLIDAIAAEARGASPAAIH